MEFCSEKMPSLEHLEVYQILSDEMSKYKTLNHENLQWDIVQKYALEILQEYSLDLRVFQYFVLSCIQENHTQSLEKLIGLLGHILKLLKSESQAFGNLESSKKHIKNILIDFIDTCSALNLFMQDSIKERLNAQILEFGAFLSYSFKQLAIQEHKVQEKLEIKTHKEHSVAQINALNDREYRDFCQQFIATLLEKDSENLLIYALMLEAMWGRIQALPFSENTITKLRSPDTQLVYLLMDSNTDNTTRLKLFIENLILNPFWLDGVKLFCEFLESLKYNNAKHIICTFANAFLERFQGLQELKFENNTPLCAQDTLQYFSKKEITKQALISNKSVLEQSLEESLNAINIANCNNSLKEDLHTLMDLAKAFEEKGMQSNAKALYSRAVALMDATPLSAYLEKEYVLAKNKINLS